jgi:hypothetical protein
MVEPPTTESTGELLGRERERDTIQLLLAAAQAGEGGALVIRGEAGFGPDGVQLEIYSRPDAPDYAAPCSSARLSRR